MGRQKKYHDARLRKEAEDAAIAARSAEEEYLREVELAEIARSDAEEAAARAAKKESLRQHASEEAAIELNKETEKAADKDVEATSRVQICCKADGDHVAKMETGSEATLEDYKKVIDATTKTQPFTELPSWAEWKDSGTCCIAEWKDLSSGATMCYARDDESVIDDVVDDHQTSSNAEIDSLDSVVVPNQKWEDPETGTVMNYAYDEGIALGDDDEYAAEWKDLNSGATMSYACDNESDIGDAFDDYQNPETGTKMNYAYDDSALADYDEHAAEWKDLNTGATMSYACDDKSDIGDAFDDYQNPETGTKMNYAYDDDSDLGDDDDYAAWLEIEGEYRMENSLRTKSSQKPDDRRFASRVHRRRVINLWQKRRV